jgi:hypothetical protein
MKHHPQHKISRQQFGFLSHLHISVQDVMLFVVMEDPGSTPMRSYHRADLITVLIVIKPGIKSWEW